MKSFFPPSWTRRVRPRVLAWIGLPLAAAAVIAITFAQSATTAPNIRAVALSSDPLYATTSGDKPALALALSVEYPTVGAQYTPSGDTDNTYSNLNEYLGYYDAEACYRYNDAPTETPGTGQTQTDLKRFDRILTNARTDRKCDDGFSGNFLNWASSSAIDMLRLALSGGDRYIDTGDLTILQRAVIPNGDPICMWNTTNFPAKQLKRSGDGTSPYWGAVPQAMITAAGANDIWVANTLNRIYFGTSRGGSCGSTGSYSLSTVSTGPAIGPIANVSTSRPSGMTNCGNENATCSFSGVQEVWYGANNSWKVAPVSNGTACSNGVFGDPLVGTAKACYYRPYTGTWRPPGSTGGLNRDGFFFSRVKVCDKNADGTLADNRDYPVTFCTKYPSGNYKPTGAVQRYSDQLRLAAFGYLLDQSNSAANPPGRFGGVLRAPMKYVGAKTFDINGIENTPNTGNAGAEWNATTGVFAVNPDSSSLTGTNATFGNSGVINYLNKFGRTGVAGRYKIYDPVSELYYQTLRYLQGLQPSDIAISGLTTDMYDGYPVFTTWTDPYGDNRPANGSYSCLKSNIVTIGDINTHDGNRFPSVDVANNIPDLGAWNGVVSNFERANSTSTYIDGQGASRTTSGQSSANYSTPGTGIVGYSYWAHTHDIRGTSWTNAPTMQRPGLRVKSFLFDVNEYGAQNDPNTRRYSNQFFMAAKYGGFESDPSNSGSKPFNTFGNPFKRQDGTVDPNVWQDPANPGEASTYYLQSSARGVLTAFDSIFSRASTSARSIAGSAVQSSSVQTSTEIFQGAFDTSNWSGDLFAIPLTLNGSTLSISTIADWSASTRLAQLASPATSRNIVVGVPGGSAVPKATDFTWGSITTALQDNLNKLSPTATADGQGQDRLNFIRGSNAREGVTATSFRQRNNKLLGDIINSSVVYSGAPAPNISSTTFATFAQNNANRTAAVFVGANDGMLHAFNAATGDELFGYIPSWLGPKLSALTDKNYVGNHQSYVDGPPVVAEAQVGAADTVANWKTVLVGGTGAGGRGVFALDVTDPAAFTASNVMWEFTQDDDVDMGFVVGQPQILRMRTSAPNATTTTYKWFAAVASGVNNYTRPNTGGNYSNGNPALFLLDLSKAPEAAWTLGTNYYKISMPIDTTLAVNTAPGLLNFKAALSSGGSRTVNYIYAGDLHGNMWKLDFSAHGSAEWNMANLSFFKNGAVPLPLYVAKDASNNVQPISMPPTLVQSTANTNSVLVAFGTGKYLEVNDRASTAQNSFYVVYDNGTTTADTSPAAGAVISSRARLVPGTISGTTGAITVSPFAWGRATSNIPTTTTSATVASGWYIDYATSAERQVSPAALSGSTLVFGSLIPGTAGDAAACGVSGGSGNVYTVNVDTGVGTRQVSTVGILGQPLVIDIADAVYTMSNSTGRRTKTITSQVVMQGSGGIATSTQTTRTVVAGRLSWRQINNYLELKQ